MISLQPNTVGLSWPLPVLLADKLDLHLPGPHLQQITLSACCPWRQVCRRGPPAEVAGPEGHEPPHLRLALPAAGRRRNEQIGMDCKVAAPWCISARMARERQMQRNTKSDRRRLPSPASCRPVGSLVGPQREAGAYLRHGVRLPRHGAHVRCYAMHAAQHLGRLFHLLLADDCSKGWGKMGMGCQGRMSTAG